MPSATTTARGRARYAWLRPLGAREVPTFAARAVPVPGATSSDSSSGPETVVIERRPSRDDSGRSLAESAKHAERLVELVHPNLAAVRGLYTFENDILTVSDFVEGETFSDLTQGTSTAFDGMPFAVRLRIVVDILGGLSALHGSRDGGEPHVHGNLVPENVVVGSDGRTRLLQVCNLSPGKVSPASPTLSYIAPELLTKAGKVGAAIDIYSAGVLLWEALCGRRLLVQTNATGLLLYELGRSPPRGIAERDLPWAHELVPVAARALSEAASRYESAMEMATAIRVIAQTHLASVEDVAAFVARTAGEKIAARTRTLAALAPDGPYFEPADLDAVPPDKEAVAIPSTRELASESEASADAGSLDDLTHVSARRVHWSVLVGALGACLLVLGLAGVRAESRWHARSESPPAPITAVPVPQAEPAPPAAALPEPEVTIELFDARASAPRAAVRPHDRPKSPVPSVPEPAPPAPSENKRFNPRGI
jgi:hypothetical protein